MPEVVDLNPPALRCREEDPAQGPAARAVPKPFTAIRGDLIALAGPVLWLAAEQHRRGLCEAERFAPYAWQVHGSALTLTTRRDSRCSNRAVLFGGTWTHQRQR